MPTEENQDSPDIYDVNVYSWDIQVSALHYAVILGHNDIVKELVQAFGADPLVPVRLVDSWNSRPRSAILTPVLALSLSPDEACAMVELLLKLGASSSQADMERDTLLHRVVGASQPDVMQVLLQHDAPAALKAINFITATTSYIWGPNGAKSPLMTAIKNRDFAMTSELLQAGARSVISFKDYEANNKDPQRTMRTSYELTRQNFSEKIEQPIMTAAKHEDPRAVKILLEHGANINTLNCDGYALQLEDSEVHNTSNTYYVGTSLLDLVRYRIKSLQKWDPEKKYENERSNLLEPEPMPAAEHVLAGAAAGSFERNRLESQLASGKKTYEEETKNYQRRLKDKEENTGLKLKRHALQSAITDLQDLEKYLIERGAKTFIELCPKLAGTNEENRRSLAAQNGPMTHYGSVPKPWKFEPDTGFGYSGSLTGGKNKSEDDEQKGYKAIFEGAWTGDVDAIRCRTLQKWSEGDDEQHTPLNIARGSNDQFTALTLAIVRGHLDCAKAILDIHAAQYSDPNDPDKKKKYQINTTAMDEEDGEDVDVESEDEEEPLTTNIADVSDQVKSNVTPEQALDSVMNVDRIREIRPADMPDENCWYRTVLSPLQYAIAIDNHQLFDWVLDLKMHYRQQRLSSTDFFDEPIVDLEDFKLAMELGRIELLSQLIRRTGAGLSLDALIKDSGVQIAEKPKYYQGLTVYGSKRKGWAQRGRAVFANNAQSGTPPLLHACWSGSVKSVEWALGTEPERLYMEFAEQHVTSKHMQALAKAQGGFKGQLKQWLSARGNLVIPIAVISREYGGCNYDNVEVLKYLVNRFKSLLEAKSPTNGYTPLLLAFANADVPAADILINAGASQTCRDNNGNNLVHALFNGVPTDKRGVYTEDKQKREMLDIIDPRLLPSMMLERSAGASNQSFNTPLASWLHMRKGFNQQRSFAPYRQSGWYPEDPRNYPDDNRKEKTTRDIKDLKLLLEKSPGNKELDMLDGAGDTVAHLTARCHMYPLFKIIIETRPALLFRENAVGRTPFEIARDGWLEERLKWQPAVGQVHSRRDNGELSCAPWTVATQDPEYFVGQERHEKRLAEGKTPDPECTQSFAERIWQFAVDVAGREDMRGVKRRLVSLNEANVVAERLARRERVNRSRMSRRAYRMQAMQQDDDADDKTPDEVEEWMAD